MSWIGILRLGLVQTALGAIFVLATSTLNRVMVVELALPASLPGLLVALHYMMQVLRPRLGHGSDIGGRRTPWILAGMALLAIGGIGAALATSLMATSLAAGFALAVPSFLLIGLGVGAAGTSLLVLLAARTAPARRPAAATIAWVMMIAGFIVTAATAGHFLDPFSPARLIVVATAISIGALVVSVLAVWGIEGRVSPAETLRRAHGADVGQSIGHAPSAQHSSAFGLALRAVWNEPRARRFAVFIFVSMLAYGGEDLLIEPFAGATFSLTPGQTAKLAGLLHGGTLTGMILFAVVATAFRRFRFLSLDLWMIGGCLLSGLALVGLAGVGLAGRLSMLSPLLFALGVANGGYAIAAIGSMMQRVGEATHNDQMTAGRPIAVQPVADQPPVAGQPPAGKGGAAHEGVRMGLWGAAQALAFGAGGLTATLLSDLARALMASGPEAYAAVFLCQATVFAIAALLASGLSKDAPVAFERMTEPTSIGR